MKPIFSLLTGALALTAVAVGQAKADDDYWAPGKMAARQCTSVHLTYETPVPQHTAAYTEMVVEKSAPGTYFACNNFVQGYIGVQELAHKKADGSPIRVAIFSVWDTQDSGDDPNAAPESERAKLIKRGEHVRTDRFGGEGTGGKSMRLFPWKEGDVIRTLVVEKKDGSRFRQVEGYIYNNATQKWELMSCWRVQALASRKGLGRGCGFVEDFRRNVESKQYERRATFGPALQWSDGKWYRSTTFCFTKDANPNMEINCRFNPGRGQFSLATGGNIKPGADFPVFGKKTLPGKPGDAVSPGSDVEALVNAPLLTPETYADNGKWEEE